jgi:hypothetical protein
VHLRILEKVGDDLPKARLVADHNHRLAGIDSDRSSRIPHPRIVGRFMSDHRQICTASRQRPLLVQAGEQQQIVDQPPHPRRL